MSAPLLDVTYTGLLMDPLRNVFFGLFLVLRLSRIKCSQVMFMAQFDPTAPNFGYD